MRAFRLFENVKQGKLAARRDLKDDAGACCAATRGYAVEIPLRPDGQASIGLGPIRVGSISPALGCKRMQDRQNSRRAELIDYAGPILAAPVGHAIQAAILSLDWRGEGIGSLSVGIVIARVRKRIEHLQRGGAGDAARPAGQQEADDQQEEKSSAA